MLIYFFLSFSRFVGSSYLALKTMYAVTNVAGLTYQIMMSFTVLVFFLALYSQLEVYFKYFKFETFYVLMMCTFFIDLLLLSPNFIVLFIAIEAYNISAVYLIANLKTERSLEAALKYFFIGAISSIIFVLGVSIIYCQTALLNLVDIVIFCGDFADKSTAGALIIGFFLIILSLIIKLGLPPFHG